MTEFSVSIREIQEKYKLIPLMQSRMVSQHKATESNMDGHSSSVPMTKQQVRTFSVLNGKANSQIKLEVIGIDEAQFFGDLYDFYCKAADNDGKTIVIVGLEGDYLSLVDTSKRLFAEGALGRCLT